MNNDFQKEYEDFLNEASEVSPPGITSAKALNLVREELRPPHGLIMAKLVFLQLFVGLLTLLFCPQFNLSLTNNHELFHFFHRAFGEEICLALCGGIFVGSSAMVGAYVLKESEALAIQKSKYLHMVLLSGLSVAGFMLFGAEVYLNLIPFWIVGAVGFGALFFKMNFKIKQALA
ncbi:MAG: hypothetical protein WEB87_02925 [Bacteriovoracaceae bacterium]